MKKDVALGIDIGGTNTAFGFIDREGNYLTEGNIPTAKHEDINDYLKELYLKSTGSYPPGSQLCRNRNRSTQW